MLQGSDGKVDCAWQIFITAMVNDECCKAVMTKLIVLRKSMSNAKEM